MDRVHATRDDGAPASARTIAEIERQLDVLVRSGRRAARQRAAMVDSHLQPLGFSVLVAIVRGPGRTHGDIAEAVGVDKSALSKIVGELQRRGLVSQVASAQDRRMRLLEPTPAAVERVGAALASRVAHLQARFAEWSEADIRTLRDLLSRYNASEPGG